MAWDPWNCGVHDSFGLVCHYESKTKNYFRLYFCIEDAMLSWTTFQTNDQPNVGDKG